MENANVSNIIKAFELIKEKDANMYKCLEGYADLATDMIDTLSNSLVSGASLFSEDEAESLEVLNNAKAEADKIYDIVSDIIIPCYENDIRELLASKEYLTCPDCHKHFVCGSEKIPAGTSFNAKCPNCSSVFEFKKEKKEESANA